MENNHFEIKVMVSVNLTEDKQKVIYALKNIFPNSQFIYKKE